MTNHPNRKQAPFTVLAYPGDVIARCPNEHSAQMIARLWSSRWHGWADVYDTRKDGGIIGQWNAGEPTDEFRHLADVPGLALIAD